MQQILSEQGYEVFLHNILSQQFSEQSILGILENKSFDSHKACIRGFVNSTNKLVTSLVVAAVWIYQNWNRKKPGQA
ncbi:MAG: hypothetical protein P8Y20_07415 [Gammaproteobacteria bacterium]|jgi:hypothetical protein